MKKIKRVLIANRGEIAVRVIKSLKKLNVVSVAVYAEDDAESLHVTFADKAVLLKGDTLAETYLNIHQLINIAKETGADAIHPGYGFLSENPDFARACKENGLRFIGPSAEAIQLMGNKVEARKFVKSIGIPIIEGMTVDSSEIRALKNELSFPVMIKAAAGGGGKGMRIVHSKEDMEREVEESEREVKNYFGNGEIYLEKYIKNPRHIEVQILADNHNNHLHLYERECSLQRRYQKIIEEAPAISISNQARNKLHEAALDISRAMNYTSAGTVEFLVDENENFFFLEMNTRIQVEHPVTEEITGIDLVEAQLIVAEDISLPFTQKEISVNGHAVQARLYAEDPENNFLPAPGFVHKWQVPQDEMIRIEHANAGTFEVSPKYDPMIAKVIAAGDNRNIALQNLLKTLKQTFVHGIKTNISFLLQLAEAPHVIKNDISTQYIENNIEKLAHQLKSLKEKTDPESLMMAASIYANKSLQVSGVWQSSGSWRSFYHIPFRVDGNLHHLKLHRFTSDRIFVHQQKPCAYQMKENLVTFDKTTGTQSLFVSRKNEQLFFVTKNGYTHELQRPDVLVETTDENKYVARGAAKRKTGNGQIVSPLNGTVVKVHVKNGQKVLQGDVLMVIESMKMENKIVSTEEGLVQQLHIEQGQQVKGNEILMFIKETIESDNFK